MSATLPALLGQSVSNNSTSTTNLLVRPVFRAIYLLTHDEDLVGTTSLLVLLDHCYW